MTLGSLKKLQYFYLDFDGEENASYDGELIQIHGINVGESGLTQLEIDRIVSVLNEYFAEYGMVFTTEKPQELEYSTIFVGTTEVFDAYGSIAGIAETVDTGNQIADDKAFVLVDRHDGIDQLIDTIAHEAAHLMGYDHGGEGIAAYLAGGTLEVVAGDTVSNIVLSSAVVDYRYMNLYGTANSTTISGGGSQVIYSGGVANATSVTSSGNQIISSGGLASGVRLDAASIQTIMAGGVVDGAYVASGGQQFVRGGVASNAVIEEYGYQYVSSGGTAISTTVTNAYQYVSSAGTVIDTILNSVGVQYLRNGTASGTTVNSGGTQYVSLGGQASGTTVNSGGIQNVYNSGRAYGTVVKGIQNLSSGSVDTSAYIVDNGIQYVSSRATANNASIGANGTQTVLAFGTASGTIVSSGGLMTVSSGGSLAGSNVAGGSMYLDANAITTGATVTLDLSEWQTSDGVLLNDLTKFDSAIERIRTSGGLASGVYQLAGVASSFGTSLDIGFDGAGSAAVGGFAWLAGANRYSGAAEDDMRYIIGYSGDNLVLSAHQRYELLDNTYTEAVADDASYMDFRGGTSSGYYARLTSGRSYADVFGGGSVDVTGRITLLMEAGASAAMVAGGGNGGNVTGDVNLTVRGNATGVAGGGLNANVEGSVTLDFDGTFTGRGFVAGGGLSGNVGTAGNTGAAIDMTVAISSYDVSNSFKIIGGSYATTVYSGDTTVYGGINLKLNDASAVGSQLTELVCGGSFREQVAGTSTVTGDVTITANGFVQNNLMFGGGMARAAASGTVNSIVEGGVTMDLTDIQFTTSLLALGGYSNGQRTYTQVGTAANQAGGSISIQGSSTRMAAVAGGGYAIGGGRSVVYGDVSITMTGDGMTGPQIYGGGYCNSGVVINYGKSTITVDGNSQTSNIWGGGLVYSNSEAFLTQGVVINITGGYDSSITRIFGGGRSVNAGDTSVGYNEDYTEVASSIGTNITIDSTVTVGNIYGGGYQLGTGWTGVSGGAHITIDGGTAANVFGGGYSESTIKDEYGDEVNGGAYITVNGGSVQDVYGGGHGYSTGGETTVNGGSYILFNSKDLTVDIGGYVYGGGLYRSTVNDGATIEFTGLGSNLVFSEVDGGYVCGAGTSSTQGKVNGVKHLKFTDFTGNFDAWLDQFDTVTLAGSQVAWTAPQDYLKTVSTWNFEVFDGETTLDWQSGSNNFNNDTLNLSFETSGFTGGTVIAGNSAAIFTGWNNASNVVSFNGTAGSWNSGLNAWVSTDDTWKLYLDGNSLKLGLA